MADKLKNKKSESTAIDYKPINGKLFAFILAAFALLFYYNTTFNYFSLDDNYINIENPVIKKGIAGIPEILSTPYDQDNANTFGYRPIVRISYALEYQFTAEKDYNPYVSHFINILLYLLAVLLLYQVLRRLLRNYNPWFPFLVSLLFLAHPSHTEVVASLKNRDMLFSFIFSFWAISQFVKWADTQHTKHLIWGFIGFLLALLSKETAVAQLAVFPLVLYFFTDISLKKLGWFSLIGLLVLVIGIVIPRMLLPEFSRNMQFLENPLVNYPGLSAHITFVLVSLLWYIKMLFVPYPLAYYYGYNMIPMLGWDSIWVWVSLILYAAMLVVAIKLFKKKQLLSFVILYYLINISMYANVVSPVPGIVADRYMLFPSIAFSLAIVWLLFTLFKVPLNQGRIKPLKLAGIAGIVALMLIPYGYYTHIRNAQWHTKKSLYEADMEYLSQSVKANDFYATNILRSVNRELAKPVNPYKFIKGKIDLAETHYRQAIAIDSTHYASWNNLGAIYSKIHGNQASLRAKSYQKQGKPDKVAEEEALAKDYFEKAISYFRIAQRSPIIKGSATFNIAYAYDLQEMYDSSIVYYNKVLEIDGPFPTGMSRLANAYFIVGNLNEARRINEEMMTSFPESDLPYLNMGNYYLKFQDTLGAIPYYERAVEKLTNPLVSKLLSNYYKEHGDETKAAYYLRKSYEAEKSYNPQLEKK